MARPRTLSCEVEQIIIASGSQQGHDLCARLLLDPSDSFVVEDPCYMTARQLTLLRLPHPLAGTSPGLGLISLSLKPHASKSRSVGRLPPDRILRADI